MSLTIQDCASQSAEERRARRRQRILQNSEQRLTTILSGPDGEEKRQAPSIEGFLGNEESAQKDGVNGEASNMAAANSNDRDPIQFVPPHYNDQVGQQRFWLMILLGLTFRVAAQLGWLDYVLLTFTAMFVIGELIRAIPQLRTYPKHGYLVNMLLISGLNERMVVWIGLTLDLLWDFAVDICLVTFSFICTHLALLLGNAIAAHTPCCSSSTAHQ